EPLLLGRAERDDVLRALDRGEPRLELDALRREPIEVDPREALLDRRQPLPVRALARVEDVVERAEAVDPALEVAAQIEQIAVVLQPFLEAVCREQLVQQAA